jgi:hypothetical protein
MLQLNLFNLNKSLGALTGIYLSGIDATFRIYCDVMDPVEFASISAASAKRAGLLTGISHHHRNFIICAIGNQDKFLTRIRWN